MSRMYLLLARGSMVALFAALLMGLAFADVPHLLSYQGRLTDGAGTPLTGSHNVTFKLYDAPSGGTLLWTETQVGVLLNSEGLYNVMLGSTTPFPSSVTFEEQYWLAISVDGGAEICRYELGASPYALNIADTIVMPSGYVMSDGNHRAGLALNGLSLTSGEIAFPTRTAVGLYGYGNSDVGLYARSNLWEGVIGYSDGDDGVQGVSTSNSYAGVHGINTFSGTVDGYLAFSGYGLYTPDNAYVGDFLQFATVASSPAVGEGKVYYNSTDKTLYLWDGSTWQDLVGGGGDNDWTGAGTGSMYATNTTDNVGIGITSPSYKLHIDGGDVKIGNSIGDDRKLYFGDGSYVWIGETADDDMEIHSDEMRISIGGNYGASGQVVKSDGTHLYWANDSVGGGTSLWNDGGTYIEAANNTNVIVNDAGGLFDFQVNGTSATGASIYGFHTASGAGERYGVMGSCGSLPAGSGTNYGVKGSATGGTINYAVYGDVGGNTGYGVYGTGGAGKPFGYLGGQDYAVYGEGSITGWADDSDAVACFINTSTNEDAAGIYAECANTPNYGYGGYFRGGYKGIVGEATTLVGFGARYGIRGEAAWGSLDNYAVYGYAYGDSGTKYGVYGDVSGTGTNWAGYFNGDVNIIGTLSKGGGSFLIDHPLDPLNKTLRHNFVESPENLCLYRGKVKLDANGEGIVEMPDYFAELTKENEATVTLTPIGRNPFLTSYEWNNDYTKFTVYGKPNRSVSYQVLADRDDPVMHQLYRPVEQEKGNGNFTKGKLLYPEAYGYPEKMGENYDSKKRKPIEK